MEYSFLAPNGGKVAVGRIGGAGWGGVGSSLGNTFLNYYSFPPRPLWWLSGVEARGRGGRGRGFFSLFSPMVNNSCLNGPDNVYFYHTCTIVPTYVRDRGVMEAILAFLLIGGGLIYCAACLAAFTGLLRKPPVRSDGYTPNVAVIIAARNEEENIGRLLDDLLAQDYPVTAMSVVAVDDCSEDGTAEIIRRHAESDPRILQARTTASRSPYSHKKRAIHEGILSSASEIILTVDADCRVPRGWISGMVRHFTPETELVAGAVIVEGNGLRAGLEKLEFTGIQAMAAGLMNRGFPITCNGANLAYRRASFERVGGFHGIGTLVSGDDDLLMQKIAHGGASRVVFLTGKETAVHVETARSLRELLMKRIRWASKIKGYPSIPAITLLVLFFGFFAAAPAGLGCATAGLTGFGPLALGYGLKTAGDLLLVSHGLGKNGKPGLLALFPLAELLHAPYIILVTLQGFFGRFEWRGRRTGALSGEVKRANP